MRKFCAVLIFVIFNQTIYAVSSSVDIDSYTFLAGKVNRNTCLYLEPSSSSACLETLNSWSVLSDDQGTKNSFILTSTSKMNPDFNCTFNPYYQMNCTGGEAILSTYGWVYEEYFEKVRYKNSCDYFDEVDIYLERPSISCSESQCNIDVKYSPSPSEIKVSAEITTYDKRDRVLGRESGDESDYSPFGSTDIVIGIDANVERVVLTDVSCEKW